MSLPKVSDDFIVPVKTKHAANDRYDEVVVGGIRTARLDRTQLAALMVEDCLAARREPRAPKLVFASNGQTIALYATDSEFRAIFDAADLIHADGQPVVLASRLLGAKRRIPGRSATTDFIHDASAAAAANGLSMYFLGGTEDANERCIKAMRRLYPNLKIAGRRNGYFKRSEEAKVCSDIARSGADILFVGLGAPEEYAFAVRNHARLTASWVVTCGGCYNFVTGDYPRAPMWMQTASLEWLFRIFNEPTRLFWRYAYSNPIALYLIATRTG
jgi:N-acetylglucosaminyldiphosphoundecaprenol N-acetyl-beta-D-mannosaminyltransferase